ncbi:MAG TPA: 2-phospho-L-lactate guanylyltransferase [Polyangiales bacterium]
MSGAQPTRDEVWAVVPMKSFARGKSRLQAALDDASRAALAREMFAHVLSVVRATPELSGVLVVSDGDDVAALSTQLGAHVLRDPPDRPTTLARVVDSALAQLQSRGAAGALVLMGDLPRIEVADVQQLLAALRDSDVVLAPDRSGQCTNALGLQLAHVHPTSFGQPDSFAQHQRRASELGLRVSVIHNVRIGFDVDTRAELEERG